VFNRPSHEKKVVGIDASQHLIESHRSETIFIIITRFMWGDSCGHHESHVSICCRSVTSIAYKSVQRLSLFEANDPGRKLSNFIWISWRSPRYRYSNL
jgi:hypothetical protein